MHRSRPSHATFLLAACVLAACGGGDAGKSEAHPRADAPEPAGATPTAEPSGAVAGRRRTGGGASNLALLEPEDYDSEELGALFGEIRLDGEPPERYELVASDKPECCKYPDVEHMSETVIAHDGKLQNVFVHVTRGYDEQAIPAPPEEPCMIDQRGCMYTPHVNAVQIGQKVLVHNADPTTHNVHIEARKNNVPSNKNMAKGQAPFEYDFAHEETSIRLKCDIHPWMGAWLHVSEHPWFAVTDADGRFRIPDLPPGTYTVEAIHEEYGKLRGEVEVVAGRATGFALTYSP